MNYTITARCETGHSQQIHVDGSLGLEWAKGHAGLLDGTSPMYLRSPIGTDSVIGKCGICGAQIHCGVTESLPSLEDRERLGEPLAPSGREFGGADALAVMACNARGQMRAQKGPEFKHQFIFLGDDGIHPVDERDVLRYELRPILKTLGLYYPGFGWHAFRRQNVSWRQTVGGATPLEAQKGARHTRVDMTMLYTVTDAERERQQVAAIFEKLMGGTEGTKQ